MEDEIYRDRMRKGRSSIAWVVIISLGVVLGGLMHDASRAMFAKAVIEYQLHEWKRQQEKARIEQSRLRTEEERRRDFERTQAEKARRMGSDGCRFWMEQNRNSPSDRTRTEVQKNC